jgi:dTDP-glucose pyrophosphorylase
MDKLRAIIPCAGYGTRMNMQPHESKEMLLYNGFPMINYALDLCKAVDIDPVLIIRPEKRELMRHIEFNYGRSFVQQYTPTGEWPQTILDSKDLWGYNNILILPDTRFTPARPTLVNMINLLYHNDPFAVFATHKVRDPQNWGVVRKYKDGRLNIAEKPTGVIEGVTYDAWGLIGFNRYNGVELFSKFLTPGKWQDIPLSELIPLSSFRDVTRV